MSLDAVVFNSLATMERTHGKGIFRVDENGEAYLIDELNFPETWEAECEYAISIRIGGVPWLSFYRNLIEGLPSSERLLSILHNSCRKVEFIDVDAFVLEVSEMENYLSGSEVTEADAKDLRTLFAELKTLVEVSKAEQNPIVFF